jgi:chemotaxis protein histidine kinase CheA
VHTDKNGEALSDDKAAQPTNEMEESTLNWLLDMDLSDPEENLFALDGTPDVDTSLTEEELAVARRPMTRGSAGADDLESYIGEEIVISSDTQSSDIYSSSETSSTVNDADEGEDSGPMAIDYSREVNSQLPADDGSVSDGSDILGLGEDDDMGEKFLVLKRVKHGEPSGTGESVVSVNGSAGDSTEMGEQASQETEATGGETPPLLSEVPVLRLVSAEGPLTGANDSPGDVVDYIAEVSPPSDEEEFDNYLLNGEHLQDGEPSPHELELVPLEGEGLYDTGSDDTIDFHEDFQQLAGSVAAALANVTPLVPQLIGELTLVINERLASLGLAADSVQAELMLESDSTPVGEILTEGFEPVTAVCPAPLATLQQLRKVDVDAIYLALVHTETGQRCNRLFSEDFVLGFSEAQPLVEEDIDDIFDGIDDLEIEDSSAQMLAGDDEFEFSDDGLEFSDAEVAELTDVTDVTELAEVTEEAVFQGFEEDIFADELTAGGDEAAQTDIDALFDSLGLVEDESDEICGLDMQEFSAASGSVQLVSPVEEAADNIAAELTEPTAPLEPAEPIESQAVSPPSELLESVVPTSAVEFNCIPAGITFSEASTGGGEIFADFLDIFIEEGSSELEKLEDAVAAWERDIASEEAYSVVSRILHTIKGIAKGVGLHFYGTLVHNFETLLGALPKPEAGSEGDYFRRVNAWLDACVRALDHIQDTRADIANVLPHSAGQAVVDSEDNGCAEVAETVDTAADAIPAAKAKPPVADARARQESKKIADDGAKALAAQQSVRITSEKLDDMLNLSNQAQQLSVRTAQSVTRGKRASLEMQNRLASVRAHISGIADRALRSVDARGVKPGTAMDALEMDQYSELQEAANILREGVEDLSDLVDFATRQNTQIEALLKHQTNVISSIGSSIRAARVVPVSRLMPGLRRLVRTVSVDLNKTITFQALNELGTLDRDDYARCQTILDHMVRNALDHGIESPEERAAADKPAEGLITIDIRKAGADAVITLSDDGRGIDPDKMRESAISKRLDLDVDALSDAEAVRLIFHKGFSTAGSVSQISGRGVGMDIVLTELQEMGGDIQIDSVVGRGTSFHIRVPSSITVNGALLVSAGEQSYAIPLGGLIAVEQVPVEEFFAAVQGNALLSLAGMECEPAYLATLCHTGHSLDAKTWRTSVPVIIAGSPERRMAIAVDDVEEALELVIRSLGAQFSEVPGVAGAATTAAGEAIVALDLNVLVDSVGADDQSPLNVDPDRDEALLVMVVDDSRTQRMVATSQLETVGVETLTAENGSVAIDLLNSADRLPDIILMDVEMPVKDGIQALREVRKSVRYGHVPVIMITSRTGLKHRAMAQAAGCNGYMGKPFNFRMLIGQINELTGHRLQLS